MLGYPAEHFLFRAILTPVFAPLRQPLSGALRPLTLFGSGVPAASMFFEHLADADDAALMRLINMIASIELPTHPFGDVSILFAFPACMVSVDFIGK